MLFGANRFIVDDDGMVAPTSVETRCSCRLSLLSFLFFLSSSSFSLSLISLSLSFTRCFLERYLFRVIVRARPCREWRDASVSRDVRDFVCHGLSDPTVSSLLARTRARRRVPPLGAGLRDDASSRVVRGALGSDIDANFQTPYRRIEFYNVDGRCTFTSVFPRPVSGTRVINRSKSVCNTYIRTCVPSHGLFSRDGSRSCALA